MFSFTAFNQYWERAFFGLVIGLYFLFGTYHLGQFETTDEHFWKYERIPQYWEALREGNLKKTAINDKPGITVALTSGVGLLLVDPEEHRLRDTATTEDGALTVYDAALTLRVNWAFRFPILLLNGLLLFVIFFLLKQIFPKSFVPLFTTLLTALSPVLLGISQVINPDALLWSLGWVSLLSLLAFLRTARWPYIFLSGMFTGLALLSKYTANVLFPVELSLLIVYPLFQADWQEKFSHLTQYLQSLVKAFIAIVLLACTTFSLGMPAVLKKPEKFWDSTFGFWHTMHIDWIIYLLLLLLIIDGFFLQARYFEKTLTYWKTYILPWIHWGLLVPLLFFVAVFLLSLGNQSLLPLNELLSTAKENGELAFPLLNHWPTFLIPFIKLMVASYPFFVSIHPFFWIILFSGWFFIIKRPALSSHVWLTLFFSWFSLAYFGAALGAAVLTNVRYSILLFPLFALLIALSSETIFHTLPSHFQKNFALAGSLLLIFLSALSLFCSKPFYLNYTSPLVSHNLAPHDAWGYGQYEAAQFLNTLPHADSILIWSDRNGICQFLTGPKCITGYKINLEKTRPDYFVVSKRGVERGYVPRDKATGAVLLSSSTLDRDALWRLNILNRPDNFILIVPTHFDR